MGVRWVWPTLQAIADQHARAFIELSHVGRHCIEIYRINSRTGASIDAQPE
jgi:hypothetical protein